MEIFSSNCVFEHKGQDCKSWIVRKYCPL